MKVNLLNMSVIASSLLSIASGITFYTIGTKKEDAEKKKATITVTKAHPIKNLERDDEPAIQLRAGPAHYFPIVGKITAKEEYQIIDTDGEWSRLAPIRNPAAAAWAKLSE